MSKVINFEEKRQTSIEKRKRNFERVLFTEFLGAYVELDENGTKYTVSLVDIAREGCMFQAPITPNAKDGFSEGDQITLRVYFTKDDFLPLVVNVKHAHEYIDKQGDAYMRYGCEFDKSLPSFQAFIPFIEFIYKFAEFSCVDKGESKVYFL